jgi:hypothetical protein
MKVNLDFLTNNMPQISWVAEIAFALVFAAILGYCIWQWFEGSSWYGK